MVSYLNGVPGSEVDVQVFADQVHILTSCDTLVSNAIAAPANATGLPCPPLVTHADGSAVSARNPARAGEVVVAYAVGLGQTNPHLQTGKLVTAAAPTLTIYGLDFNYRANALATKPLPNASQPLYSGATPGYVGLYQINFTIPPLSAGNTRLSGPERVAGRSKRSAFESHGECWGTVLVRRRPPLRRRA